MARLRGLGLAALAAVGPALAAVDLVALVLGVTPVVLWIRRWPVAARRLAGDWCEVPIADPYDPVPPPPRPRPDGMYEVRRRLYRRPHLPAYRRLDFPVAGLFDIRPEAARETAACRK